MPAICWLTRIFDPRIFGLNQTLPSPEVAAWRLPVSADYVVGADDAGDCVRECRAGLLWDVGVDEEDEGGLRLGKVERHGFIAEDDAGVSDPTGGVDDAQTVERSLLG